MIDEDNVTNDTPVFYALHFDHHAGKMVPAGHRPGTPEAIRREGFSIGGFVGGAPHQWLKDGFVDLELSLEHPYSLRRPT